MQKNNYFLSLQWQFLVCSVNDPVLSPKLVLFATAETSAARTSFLAKFYNSFFGDSLQGVCSPDTIPFSIPRYTVDIISPSTLLQNVLIINCLQMCFLSLPPFNPFKFCIENFSFQPQYKPQRWLFQPWKKMCSIIWLKFQTKD